MNFRSILLLIILIATSSAAAPHKERHADVASPISSAQRPAADASVKADSSLTASLITCFPGPEIYELCGHSALRIRGAGIDSVWNYGVFDFNEPNFVYRFVKGETDYMVLGYPFSYFLPEYIDRGSRVVEQDLNLTPEETARLRKLLQTASLPQNRKYRYNYIYDNCATRLARQVEKAANDSVIYPDSVRFGTFRNEMRHFHNNYPWYQFGIDLALGQGLDYRIGSIEEMFAPVVMMRNFRSARLEDGRPLVRAERDLYPGAGKEAINPPTPFWLTPMTAGLLILIISAIICIWNYKRLRISRWWWALYYGACGLTGCVSAFLLFVSEHAATSPNMLILWLNPLQLLVPLCLWSRKGRIVVNLIMWLNLLVVGLALIAWPFQPQSGNAAFLPLVLADLLLAATYATISAKTSYNIGITPRQSATPAVKTTVRSAAKPAARRRTGSQAPSRTTTRRK